MSLKQNKIKTKDRIESQHDTEALIQEQPECQLMLFQFAGSRIEAQTWQFRENFVCNLLKRLFFKASLCLPYGLVNMIFRKRLTMLVDQSAVSFCDNLFTSFVGSIKGGTN